MRFLTIFMLLLFVGAAQALQPSQWTESQAMAKCAQDLHRAYGDTLSVVSFLGNQPHENDTTPPGPDPRARDYGHAPHRITAAISSQRRIAKRFLCAARNQHTHSSSLAGPGSHCTLGVLPTHRVDYAFGGLVISVDEFPKDVEHLAPFVD